jgi:hypothetical protein
VERDLTLLRTYTLTGTVFWEDGELVRRHASVRVVEFAAGPGAGEFAHPPVPYTQVGEDGTWSLTGLLPTHVYTIQAYAGRGGSDREEGVRFPPGETVVRVRPFVLSRAPPLPTRDGGPLPKIRGRVLDHLGRPCPGAWVAVHYVGVATDSLGRFEMEVPTGAPGGGFAIRVLAAGRPPGYFVGTSPRPGGVLDLGDLRLGERGIPVSGKVVDEEGRPVPGAEVSIRFRQPYYTVTLRTDAGGEFETEGPYLGESGFSHVDVAACAPGYPVREVGGILHSPQGRIDVRLFPHSLVKGKLEFSGAPPAWIDLVGRASGEERFAVAPDPDGSFSVEVPPGLPLLRIEAPGYLPSEIERVTVGTGRVHDLGKRRLTRGGTLVVKVVDSAGRPLAGETVRIRRKRERNERGRVLRIPEARSDTKGVVRFEMLRPGTYSVVVNPDGRPGFKSATVEDEKTTGLTINLL